MKKNTYKFLGAGFEVSMIISVFFIIGYIIDDKLGTKYWSLIVGFVGILYALFSLFKKVKKG